MNRGNSNPFQARCSVFLKEREPASLQLIAKNCRMRRWIVFCLIALFLPIARGQGSRVQGTVEDGSGAAIVGADVTLLSQGFTAHAVTDSSGAFVFTDVPNPSGTIRAQAPGFAASEEAWNLNSSPGVRVTL